MRILLLFALTTGSCFGQAFGSWKMNPARSIAAASQSRKLIFHFEPHPKGEVFTLEKTLAYGRQTSSSTILYLDDVNRDLQDFGCSGTQSSRRLDSRTVEVVHTCTSGDRTRMIRRSAAEPAELIVEITEQHSGGRPFEQRLVLERQSLPGMARLHSSFVRFGSGRGVLVFET